MASRQTIIVGAGLGGLALAARLAHAGHDVTLLEKNSAPGGRCGTLDEGGYHFDTGPTLLLMPDVLDRLFSSLGANLSDYLTLTRMSPNYRLHFTDGTHFDFFSDPRRTAEVLEQIEPGAAAQFDRFLEEAGFCYRTARASFVERNFTTAGEFFTPGNLGLLYRMKAHYRLYQRICHFFKDERLRQAFSFQTMYLGISPFRSPALYSLLPYTELTEGIWYPQGGMHSLARAIARLAEERGCRIRYDAAVSRIETSGSKATGVTLESGERIEADLVIANADLPYVVESLLPPEPQRRWKFTSSGFLIHLGLNRRYEGVPHHSVFFSSDYARNFREIFEQKCLPRDPAFYLCRPTATDPTVAPPGCDVLYLLAPMPHLEGKVDWSAAASTLRSRFFERLRGIGIEGLEESIVVERTWTPHDFASVLNLASGCAFGLSHDMLQVGYLRPHNRHRRWDNLYFVGASTHPGTGIPMVLFSAELVEQRIAKEWQ